MGHVTVSCDSCHAQLREAIFYEPLHDAGQRPLAGRALSPLRPSLAARPPWHARRYAALSPIRAVTPFLTAP
jgi:hypothetical protein